MQHPASRQRMIWVAENMIVDQIYKPLSLDEKGAINNTRIVTP